MARGQTPISHAAFERLPSDKSHNYLRDLLAALAVLPAYEARIERITPWLDDLLATLPKPDAEIVERFARWQVIRTLRRKADRNDLTTPVVFIGRAQIRAAVRFLAWCAAQGTMIQTMTQTDLETHLATHQGSARTQHAFIGWVRTTGLNPALTIPAQPEIQPTVTVSDDQRWAQVETLLHDDTLRHYTRIAGLFMLLFVQPLTAICRMRTDQVDPRDDGRVFVTFEKTSVEMPAPLDRLIREHLQHRGQASYASRDSGWLFPGGIPGRPLTTENIRSQLVARGIKPNRSRKAALFQLAAEIPTPLLAEILGIGHTTANRWAALAARSWAGYIAERETTR